MVLSTSYVRVTESDTLHCILKITLKGTQEPHFIGEMGKLNLRG